MRGALRMPGLDSARRRGTFTTSAPQKALVAPQRREDMGGPTPTTLPLQFLGARVMEGPLGTSLWGPSLEQVRAHTGRWSGVAPVGSQAPAGSRRRRRL